MTILVGKYQKKNHDATCVTTPIDMAKDNLGLLIVSHAGDLDKVKELLEEGCNPNFFEDCSELTCLHHAAAKGHYEVVKLLIEHGANPWLREKFFGESVVDRTRDDGDIEMLKI